MQFGRPRHRQSCALIVCASQRQPPRVAFSFNRPSAWCLGERGSAESVICFTFQGL